MKKYLITGLIILLPLALTIIVINFIFNLLTAPFTGIVENILNYFGLFNHGFLFFTAQDMKQIVSKISILLFLFAFTVTLGALTRWYLINHLIKLWDAILHRIPFVRNVYKICQDVIRTIFSREANSFKQVVLVPFPHANALSIGFVTRDDLPPLQKESSHNLVAVFIPTTPNPTSGFLSTFEDKDLIYLDMTVEEAFKSILSCGSLLSAFRTVSKEEALAIIQSSNLTTN